MSITIREIAKLANVSIGTVSRVLNNKETGYTEETKAKVLDIIKKYDYIPNSAARALSTQSTKTLGCIIPDICNPFFPELARGIEDMASTYGYHIFLCNTDLDAQKEESYVYTLLERQVDGLLFASSTSNTSKNITRIQKANKPIILLDACMHDKNIPHIYIDNSFGVYTATKHLIEKGHTSIAFITGTINLSTSKERLRGYETALKEAGLPLQEQLIIEGDYTVESGVRAMEQLSLHSYTALLASNDLMAYGVYKYARTHGIRIPEDLSIIGFDNLSFSQIIDPPLTTVSQPAYELGQYAAEMLIKCLQGMEAPSYHLYKPTLIIRESVQSLHHT